MLTGTITSQLIDNARIWTLTVPTMPQPGELITWTDPAQGSIPQRQVRGWLSPEPSTRAGTSLLIVASESTRWVIIQVQPPKVFTKLTYNENIALTAMMNRACKRYGTVLNHWDHFQRDTRLSALMADTQIAYSDAYAEAREINHELLGQRTGLGL